MPPRIRIDGTVPPDVNSRYQRRKPGIRNDLVNTFSEPNPPLCSVQKQSDPIETRHFKDCLSSCEVIDTWSFGYSNKKMDL